VRDLCLDADTGDLLLSDGAARLTAPGTEATRQRMQLRLSFWQGEWRLDRRVGIPYAQRLGRKGGVRFLRDDLRRAAATCPGVARLDTFSATLGADRGLTVGLEARALDGSPVSLADFVAGEG